MSEETARVLLSGTELTKWLDFCQKDNTAALSKLRSYLLLETEHKWNINAMNAKIKSKSHAIALSQKKKSRERMSKF